MELNIKPLGGRVVLQAIEETNKALKKGDIIIPDSAKEKPTQNLVVALGTGKLDSDGKKIAFEVKKGDRVLVNQYGGTEIKLNGKDYKICSTEDILAVFN